MMRATNKLRISTTDASNALGMACSEVESAVGLPVQAEFQEIEGDCLIVEIRLGTDAVLSPPASRLAHSIDKSANDVRVLSVWSEPVRSTPAAKFCADVLGADHDAMPPVALRAIEDDLPTAQWDRSTSIWHLAVPSECRDQVIVGMLHRTGYSHRFSTVDAFAFRSGLAS
jgi:hypothetical protein